MLYVKIINGAVTEYPYDLGSLRRDYPDTSFPRDLTLMPDMHLFNVFVVAETLRPTVTDAQRVDELPPVVVEGAWVQQWQVRPATQAELDLAYRKADAVEEGRIAKLWQAAHEYEFAQVSGSAIGLLAMGVMQGKPKCFAVQMWIKGIWTLYYTRKASGDRSTDFSSCGNCPHSVPELMEELGV